MRAQPLEPPPVDDTKVGAKASCGRVRRFGHDLGALCDALVSLVAAIREYPRRPVVQADLRYLSEDSALREMLGVLTAYGQAGRYRYIDQLSGPGADAAAAAEERWREVEWDLVKARSDFGAHAKPPRDSEKPASTRQRSTCSD